MTIDAALLSILACPLSKQPLREEGDWLICDANSLKYPVRNNIPVLLIEEARTLDGGTPDPDQLVIAKDEGAA